MAIIDIEAEAIKLQETLDGITKNGFWFGIYFPEGDNLTFHPYRLEVLGARPKLNSDGSVKSWIYPILMIDRNFIDFGAGMHGSHLHFITKIKWERGRDGRIYAGRLYDEDENKIVINELDWSEDPVLADEWKAYVKRIEAVPEQVEESRQEAIKYFLEMVEARFS